MRDELELKNVGIAVVDLETKRPDSMWAPNGKPVPDRRGKAESDMNRLLRNV
jgi:hypothetical protein